MRNNTSIFIAIIVSFIHCAEVVSQDSMKTSSRDSIGELDHLRQNIGVQSERLNLLLYESERNFDLASKIIDWSAMFFAILVVFLGIAGWIGARRFKQIDETGEEMRDLLEKMRSELAEMQDLRNKNQEEINDLKKRFEKERRETMAIVYYMNQGELAFERGELDEAIHIYTKIMHLKPDSPEALFMLGNAHSANGNYEDAIKYLRKAIEQKPDYYEAYYNLGRTYRRNGEFDLSIEYLKKSLELNPKYVNATTNLGHVYLRKHEIEKAVSWYQKSVEIDPEYSLPYLCLARIAYQRSETERALKLFNTAKGKIDIVIRRGKARHWDIYHLGEIQIVLNNVKEAESHFAQALMMNSAKETLRSIRFNLNFLKSSPVPPPEIEKFVTLIEDRLNQ